MVGKTLGHYHILEKLGEGGMGVVYRAHDKKLERDVALKVLPASSFSDPDARARLLREARSAAGLNHPHICTIYEVGEADGQAYIAMELVEGQPLNARLAGGTLPTAQVLRYGLQLADALGHAHEHGIVHRDLKSANVVITPEGRAKVLDFGLAKRLSGEELDEATRSQASLTAPGTLAGTLAYMAPEQLRGQPADARSDIWALGVMLYEMAAGVRPFQGQTGFEVSSAILREPPPPLPLQVPAGVQAVILRCLEKEPGQRYQRAGEVRAALEAIQRGAAPPLWVSLRYVLRRRWLALAGTGVVLLAVLVALNHEQIRTRFGGSAPRIESLAVLPLKNLSGDPQQEYFVDGTHEALITELSKIRALKVISRTSVMRYKNTAQAVPQIARELAVDGVVEGSVQREGDQVRITVQLIHGPTDRHLWAASYDRELRRILALQSEVARAIAREIRVTLTPEEETRLADARPMNPDAYEAYLKGRQQWHKFALEGMKKSLTYFQTAIRIDPAFAPAYLGVADAYLLLGSWYGDVPPREAFRQGKPAIQKAIELDPLVSEGHSVLGGYHFQFDWDWAAAERAFLRGIELRPNLANTHGSFSVLLRALGRFRESEQESERALMLDPLAPIYHEDLGSSYFYEKQYEKALLEYLKALELDPNFVPAYEYLGYIYVQQRRYQEAIAAFEKAAALTDRYPERLGDLGYAYAVSGNKAAARKILEELKRVRLPGHVSVSLARVYAALGEKDEAFSNLAKGFQEGNPYMIWIKVHPTFESLRSDARFQDLLRRMNFPK